MSGQSFLGEGRGVIGELGADERDLRGSEPNGTWHHPAKNLPRGILELLDRLARKLRSARLKTLCQLGGEGEQRVLGEIGFPGVERDNGKPPVTQVLRPDSQEGSLAEAPRGIDGEDAGTLQVADEVGEGVQASRRPSRSSLKGSSAGTSISRDCMRMPIFAPCPRT